MAELVGGLRGRTVLVVALLAALGLVVALLALPDPVMAATPQQVGRNTLNQAQGLLKPLYSLGVIVIVVGLLIAKKAPQAMLFLLFSIVGFWMIWSPNNFANTLSSWGGKIFGA